MSDAETQEPADRPDGFRPRRTRPKGWLAQDWPFDRSLFVTNEQFAEFAVASGYRTDTERFGYFACLLAHGCVAQNGEFPGRNLCQPRQAHRIAWCDLLKTDRGTTCSHGEKGTLRLAQ